MAHQPDAIRFAVLTQGCRSNQFESRSVEESWLARGCAQCGPEEADWVLVNSCAVTAKALSDLRALVRRVHRANPAARIVIAGCAASIPEPGKPSRSLSHAQPLHELPGVARILPQARKALLLEGPSGLVSEPGESDDLPACSAPVEAFRVRGAQRARALCRVQDGCSAFCAYCIVPYTRGPAVSRQPGEILDEVRGLFEAGYGEVVLTGINLGAFGRDLDDTGWDFWRLVDQLENELADWRGKARLRASSLDPGLFGERAIAAFVRGSGGSGGSSGSGGLLAPHAHLSLQSMSLGVLQGMGRRHYTPEAIASFMGELTSQLPLFGLGADLLAGFPGESEAEFAETLAGVSALPLTYAHVFPYSRRPGTRAAAMPGQVPRQVKTERAAALRQIVEAKQQEFLARLAACEHVDVILETEEGGTEAHFAACRFTTPPGGPLRRLVRGRPVGVQDGALLVEPETQPQGD